MKSTVEKINPVQYRVAIEISLEEVNQAFETVYRGIQKKAKIQGFRPGKAPLNVIRKFYAGNVASDVHEKLVNQHLFAALNEQSIRPIASPVVETSTVPKEGDLFTFTAIVDVMPEIKIEDYKGVAVNADAYKVKDETIERELYMVRRRQARTRPVEPGQPAAKGMLAAVSHKAALEGVDVPGLDVDGMTVFLGEKEIFEDLENEIIGMTAGQTKSASIRVPETYGDTALAGKDLQFTIAVNDLKHMDVPALDDEFAKDLNFESADRLKEDVKTHLEARAKELGRQRLETAVLDKILGSNPFDVPPAMVDQVIDSMIQEHNHQSDDDRQRALRDQELRRNLRETAKRRTQNTLLLWHVTQQEKLTVADDEVKERIEQTIASTGLSDPKQLARLRKNIEPRVRENMIFEKAMDFLINSAQVTEIPAEI